MLSRIKQLVLLSETDLNSTSVHVLQQSLLRIILTSGLILVLTIVIHSSWQAYQVDAWYIIGITCSFYLVLLLALYFSSKLLTLSKSLLLLTVFGAGLCMLLFIDNFELSKLGVIFVYTAPVIAMLFFSRTMTIVVMALNVIPYLYLLFGTGPINLFNISITLPATPAYLHSLLFLFFNLCIPLAVMRVISTLKRNAATLQQQNEIISQSNILYQDIFNHHTKATLLLSSEGEILKANGKAKKLLNLSHSEQGLIQDQLNAATAEQAKFWLGHETECSLKSNASTHILLNHLCRTQHQHHLVQIDDITPLKQLHQKLTSSNRKQNLWRNYDSLTSLPEYNFFLQLIKLYGECKAGSLMMIVRLCHVKAFNHAHSYHAGDELLSVFASEFRAALPENVMSARLRGVKFIVWCPLSEHSTSFSDEALKIQHLLPKLLNLNTGNMQPAYEIGVSISSQSIPVTELMLEQCEAALESADAYTRPLSFYQADILDLRNHELQLLAEFKKALQEETPKLWLQPKVRPDGTIISFEALMRWQDKDGKYIAPDILVTLAEQYGLIVQLSFCVLAKALAIIEQFKQHNITYPIAINLTGSDLLCDKFYNTLIDIATHQPKMLKMLSLELTENSVVRHQQPLFNKLSVLTRLGYDIALDDFGTGQATLSTLSQLPVSTIKLDKSFLINIPADHRQTMLIQSVMQMAKTLKLAMIIEGVETDIQRRFLQSLGAKKMQGYYFSKPMPVDHWLTQLSLNTAPLQHIM